MFHSRLNTLLFISAGLIWEKWVMQSAEQDIKATSMALSFPIAGCLAGKLLEVFMTTLFMLCDISCKKWRYKEAISNSFVIYWKVSFPTTPESFSKFKKAFQNSQPRAFGGKKSWIWEEVNTWATVTLTLQQLGHASWVKMSYAVSFNFLQRSRQKPPPGSCHNRARESAWLVTLLCIWAHLQLCL